MGTSELYEALNYVNHSREKRLEMAHLVSENPHLVKPLLDIALKIDDPISAKACWVMEFTARENLPYIFPHLDPFTENLQSLKLESSIRPFAKICELLCISYFKQKDESVQNAVGEIHLERMATACFDWLIGDYKVAPKAYSMTSLLLMGSKFKWIHPELKMVLEQNYGTGSAAYKARSRMILTKLKKAGF
ncbi:adenylosuccinate lyase [Maribacter sp. 2210JD10-5]|uniref:adenylosuccinate lyase n=1 Tax=Maribacter sp. 2210JD10-5 TaxID=3386272 RepID=UPI0039BC4EDF